MAELSDMKKMNQLRARVSALVTDPDTAASLQPWYAYFCKRPGFSDTYLQAFNRPNVTLIDTAGAGIDRITADGAVVGDTDYPLDCLILSTGFELGTDFVRRYGYEAFGPDGTRLTEAWAQGPHTLHGMQSHGFPSLFFMGFIQTAQPVSITYALDEQATHIAYLINEAREARRGVRRGNRGGCPGLGGRDGGLAQAGPALPPGLHPWFLQRRGSPGDQPVRHHRQPIQRRPAAVLLDAGAVAPGRDARGRPPDRTARLTQKERSMAGILDGIRVIDLASWVFVPGAAAILADWGAEVIKIEHPVTGDPLRGLNATALPSDAPHVMLEQANRGKRSIALDVTTPGGRQVFDRLIGTADVFMTNWLGKTRRREKIDVADLQALNDRLIYVRGSGQGPKGEEADRPGYDATTYWYRAGFAYVLSPEELEWPIGSRLGLGDLPSAAMLAGGVAGALFARERTGETPVVDASLLSCAAWHLAPDISYGKIRPSAQRTLVGRGDPRNPIANLYRTKDDRIISLVMMDSDRYWTDFCTRIGRPDLIDHERFHHSSVRAQHGPELMAILDEVFAARTLAEWRPVLHEMKGAYGIVQTPAEAAVDPQMVANGFIAPVQGRAGAEVWLTSGPIQYDEAPTVMRPMPQLGEHTDEVLPSLGYDCDEIVSLKVAGAVL